MKQIDNNYSFNPMLESQFLCFGVFGQSFAHLPKRPKILQTIITFLSPHDQTPNRLRFSHSK